jgi:hypothetical protein
MKRHFTFPFLICLLLSPGLRAAAAIDNAVKVDHFGYRPAANKIAYFSSSPGAVEIHRSADDSLATTATVTDHGVDAAFWNGCYSALIDGDHVWWADFSGLTELGRFYAVSPSLNLRSYDFQVSDTIYQAPLLATLKALYLQRCGCAHPAAYAGANWADASACHLQDATAVRACASVTNYGTLDLSGGWHDAGDYNKYIGSTNVCNNWNGDSGNTLWYLLSAYELNPTWYYDGQGNIPESGNGVPDILDECKWELDWYLKMKMTDNHVLSILHQTTYTGGAPPSTDATTRYYYSSNNRSDAIFVANTAHAARLLAAFPAYAAYAATLKAAALATWTSWVSSAGGSQEKLWAAAELYRLDSSQASAKAYVDGYTTWSSYGVQGLSAGGRAMVAYIQAPGATASVVNGMKTSWGNRVNWIFTTNDHYNSGITPSDYFWSSNEVKSDYAMALVWGAQLGATGTHTVAQCMAHAEDYLHYLNGANAMNMVYMSNTEDMGGVGLGAKHGIWRLYHSWFGDYGKAYSKSRFIGKPAAVVDALYPYYTGPDNYGISDTGSSSYGPAPGFVVDGPTYQYHNYNPTCTLNGQSMPPNLATQLAAPYAKAYRDWNYSDPTGSETMPWIVNETGIYYISSYSLLSSQFQGPAQTPTASPTVTPFVSATESPTHSVSPTQSPTPSVTSTRSATPTLTSTRTSSPTRSATPSFSVSPTPSPSHSPSPTDTDTPTPTPPDTATLSPTLIINSGIKRVDASQASPNPNPGSIMVKLAGDMDEIELRIYSPALVMASKSLSGPLPMGWSGIAIDPGFLASASNGLYYYRLLAKNGEVQHEAARGKFYILR